MSFKINIQLLLFLLIGIIPFWASAHEIRPAYLEITQIDTENYQLLWKVPTISGRSPKIDPILPGGFNLQENRKEYLPDAFIRHYNGSFKESLNGKQIAIQGLELTLVDVLVQINLLEDISYTILLQPDHPAAIIPIEPNKWEVSKLYILLGIEHILIGIDHLLFVLGLLLLVQNIGQLIKTVTAFTIAHSVTLGLSALDLVQIPQAPVEAVIALSIIFLAREYISHKKGKPSLTVRYPWIVAFLFGLLHGFGFAGALSEIGFPQKEIPLALFTFNVGVEIGQLIFIGLILFIIIILKYINLRQTNWTWKIIPYSMGIIATFWLIERILGF